MFCEYCGKQLKDGEICSCWYEEGYIQPKQPTVARVIDHTVSGRNAAEKKKGLTGKALLVGIVFVCLIVGVVVMYLSVKADTISLQNYLSKALIPEGYSGAGTFEPSELFDMDRFMEEVCGKNVSPASDEYRQVMNSIQYRVYVNDGLDKEYDDLKNGDKVVVEVYSTMDGSEAYKKKFQDGSKSYVVVGLTQATAYSPFDEQYFTVSFGGASGSGELYWSLSEESPLSNGSLIRYIVDDDLIGSLSNGDVVTIRVKYDEETLSARGLSLSETSRDYVVEGLGTYVASGEELSGQFLSGLYDKAVDVAKAEADDMPNVLGELVAAYYMKKDPDIEYDDFFSVTPENRVVLVFSAMEKMVSHEWVIYVEYKNISCDGNEYQIDGFSLEDAVGEADSTTEELWQDDIASWQKNYIFEEIPVDKIIQAVESVQTDDVLTSLEDRLARMNEMDFYYREDSITRENGLYIQFSEDGQTVVLYDGIWLDVELHYESTLSDSECKVFCGGGDGLAMYWHLKEAHQTKWIEQYVHLESMTADQIEPCPLWMKHYPEEKKFEFLPQGPYEYYADVYHFNE